jgi:hypothetical protein
MIVRKQQLRILEQAARESFCRKVTEDLAVTFPQECALMSKADLDAKVTAAFQTAGVHGFESQNGLRLFAELSFLLGAGFDADPLYPWVGQFLGSAFSDEIARVEGFHAQATDYLDAVHGPDDQYREDAIARLWNISLKELPTASLEGG